MSEQTQPRFRTALAEEISTWQHEGLIDTQLAQLLQERYPLIAQSSKLMTIALIVGAVMVGLGAILFVSSNWSAMTAFVKLFVILAAMASSYGAAWYLKYEPGNNPKVGSAMLLVGTLVYGAGIWLISQTFNLEASASTELLLWTLGAAAMTVVTRSSALGVLTSILVFAWNISNNTPTYALSGTSLSHEQFAYVAISSVLTAALAFVIRSRAATYFSLCTPLVWVLFATGTGWAGGLLLASFFISVYFLLKQKHETLATPYLYLGTACGFVAGLASTLGANDVGSSIHNIHEPFHLAALIVAAVAAAAAVLVRKDHNSNHALLMTLGTSFLAAILNQMAPSSVQSAIGNLLLICMFVFGLLGGSHLKKGALINLTVAFVVIDISCRYFDVFYSLLNRSLLFAVGGLILIAIGTLADTGRRRLLRSIG
jgi:uncharacterized membrane protein